MAEIQTMFIRMNKGVCYDQNFLDKHGLDGFMKIPMSIESFTIPDQLAEELKNMITNFKGISPPGEGARKYVESFVAELKKNSEILNQFVDKELILTKAFEQLN